MLKDYPVKINGVSLFDADKWTESWEKITNTYTTAAGTEQVDVVRQRKLKIDAQFSCSSSWAHQFAQWSAMDSLSVEIYDTLYGYYGAYYMRIEDYKCSLVKRSKTAKNTNGLYEISFTLEEF